jgi:hypothetical protein
MLHAKLNRDRIFLGKSGSLSLRVARYLGNRVARHLDNQVASSQPKFKPCRARLICPEKKTVEIEPNFREWKKNLTHKAYAREVI